MTSPPDGTDPTAPEHGWSAPEADPVSLNKPNKPAEPEPPLDFDPYRFGAPEHPVPPEYAPPGYRPPPPPPPVYPQYAQPTHPQYPPPAYPTYPPGAPYAPTQSAYPQPKAGNGKATASLVLGIVAILLCWLSLFDLVPIILAVIFGILGLTEANRRPTREGKKVAIAGIACGVAGAILATVLTVVIYTRVKDCLNYPTGSSEYTSCINNKL